MKSTILNLLFGVLILSSSTEASNLIQKSTTAITGPQNLCASLAQADSASGGWKKDLPNLFKGVSTMKDYNFNPEILNVIEKKKGNYK